MRLRYISVPHLISAAGGDPWAVNRTLQSGRPVEISDLAQAFHDAGQQTNESEAAFNAARERFADAWNNESGGHPINDAAEVRRAVEVLGVQAAQLPKIAIDLERVAAALAETQRLTSGQIRTLEGQLEDLDRRLNEAFALTLGGPSVSSESASQRIAQLEQRAIDATAAVLNRMVKVRDIYSEVLHLLMTRLREIDGYDAAPITGLDVREAESPEDAESDVHAALAGDQAAAKRVNSVLDSITAEQRAGKVPLAPEQASALSQLQAQQHGMSIEALQTVEQRLADQREMIANSWQLMSNTALTFPRTELKPGAVEGTEMVRGDFGQLPDSVRQILESPWSQYYDLTVGRILAAGDPTKIVTDIVRHGKPSFQTNTELDRRMLSRASAMMDDTFGESASPAQIRLRELAFDPIIASIFAAVAPDHQVVHDVITGPSRAAFLHNITHQVWSDHGKGAASLLDWTEASARGPQSYLAGETARAYGSYVGEHGAELLQLPGNRTLGASNPDLVRAMAHGLTPYLDNIAGLPTALAEFGHAPDTAADIENGRMPIAKGIFSVLSSDDAASRYFNGAADHQAIVSETAYAQALAHHEPNMASYNANLHDAMTLRGLVNSGIHATTQADVENHRATQEEAQLNEYNFRKEVYEAAAKGISSVAGFVPGAGPYASAGISMLGTAIESDYVGPAPTGHPMIDHPIPDMSISQADREILNAVIASGQHVPIAPEYLIEGRVATPDELARTPLGFRSGEYDQVLSRALAKLYTQNYGDGAGRPWLADQNMIDRYAAVIKDPFPPELGPKK